MCLVVRAFGGGGRRRGGVYVLVRSVLHSFVCSFMCSWLFLCAS